MKQDEEIRKFSERTGEEVGRTVTNFLTDAMKIILERRSDFVDQKPLVFPGMRLLKPVEVAEILNISKAKAYQMMQRGEIPVIKMGRITRVKARDLEEFIESMGKKEK